LEGSQEKEELRVSGDGIRGVVGARRSGNVQRPLTCTRRRPEKKENQLRKRLRRIRREVASAADEEATYSCKKEDTLLLGKKGRSQIGVELGSVERRRVD